MRKFLDKEVLSIVPLRLMIRNLRRFRVHLTVVRILNLMKILASLFLSRMLRRSIVWGVPPIIMIEPTNICNLKCPMCPSGNGDMTRPRGRLDYAQLKILLEEVGSRVLQIQFWNQGEPFLHRQFLDMVREAKKYGVMTLTSSNGHFIRSLEDALAVIDSGLDQIIFSLEGTNPETYARYRLGGDFHVVMQALAYLAEARRLRKSRLPLIELQFLVFDFNLDEIEDLLAIADRHQVDRIAFKTAQIYSVEQGKEFLPKDSRFSRYQWDGSGFRLKGRLPNWCKRLWLNTTINWDGSVSPCCFDKDAEYAMGRVFGGNSSLKEIFHNHRYQSFRRRVLKDRSCIGMCNNCTEGLPEPYARIIDLQDKRALRTFLQEVRGFQVLS